MRSIFRPLLTLGLILTAALPVAAAVQPLQQSEASERLLAEFRDARARSMRLRAQAQQASTEVAALEQQLSRLAVNAGPENSQVLAQRARLAAIAAREAPVIAALAGAKSHEAAVLSALQTLSRYPPPPLVVPRRQAIDTVRAAVMMKALAPELRARTAAISAGRSELERVRRQAVLGSEALFTTDSIQGQGRAEAELRLAAARNQAAVLLVEAQGAERSSLVLAARLRTEGLAPPPPDPDSARLSALSPAGGARLDQPVTGTPTQRFGSGASGWRWSGDQLEARAPVSAEVAYAGLLAGLGQVVVLDLGTGWLGVVSGLEKLDVRTGVRVERGQMLGRGPTGGTVGFDLRRDERPVDPAPYLR